MTDELHMERMGRTSPRSLADPKDFGAEIARLVHDAFEKEGKKGFPKEGEEWTVLSGIVMERRYGMNSTKTVVSLGTGTNCLGRDETTAKGILVHDSHAEVVCKRAFVSFLMDEIKKEKKPCDRRRSELGVGTSEIFCKIDSRSTAGDEDDGGGPSTAKRARLEPLYDLRENIRFHFYSSHPPCGDATISPKDDGSADIYRTGAKCPQDLELPERSGASYHALGAVRTKPGRGTPTSSLSCSDKMTKWNLVGLQGSLLASLTTGPIRWSSITIGCQGCLQSLDRALFKRLPDAPKVDLHTADIPFRFQKGPDLRPCKNSLAYNIHGLCEVMTEGRKQGVVKKHWLTDKAAVQICRKMSAKKFLFDVLEHVNLASKEYQELKSQCRTSCTWGYVDKKAKFDALVAKTFPNREDRRKVIDKFNFF